MKIIQRYRKIGYINMGERQIIVDGQGHTDAIDVAAGRYYRYEELEVIMVADSQGEVHRSPLVELDEGDFPQGVVICPEEEGVRIVDAIAPGVEERALRNKSAYFMDLVGRIMEVRTGNYVTGRRDIFGFHISILELYESDQANRLH